MASFKPEHFVPVRRQREILAMPVTQIIAAAHAKDAGTNHWCLYLATSSETSVRIDCQPSFSVPSTVLQGGSKANVIISELRYLISHQVEAQFALDVKPG